MPDNHSVKITASPGCCLVLMIILIAGLTAIAKVIWNLI